ncbi:glycosyltransferase family 4 protein [Reichenbachiella ulvae]|uniref:Glycosyltransferase family 4 protein n=1 Tax=Reichenbachiella ulvae TaxID=2980104 RepID=A0ABT3CVM7_9BACT|nr:glycosyltransferase family 4 protein [Reichenbachiella ulvae]MCV9387677.1 glycosyltransferase family 4 protein [Reichenbachiella ulvae]
MPKKLLFLTPYPKDTAASQRFRFEQYIPLLEAEGWQVDRQSFIDDSTWKILYLPGHHWSKLWGTVKGFSRRIWMLLRANRYEFIFIHREAAPMGPPVFEWILAKVLKKKLIYDFDDAIWKENTTGNNSLASKLKWPQKVANICRWSHRISAGNAFLAQFARTFNPKVTINPTTLDTNRRHIPAPSDSGVLVIGWTGTHSTLKYLKILEPIIAELQRTYAFQFLVIADQKPELNVPNWRFIPWNKETEIDDLNLIDIGVMPLEVDEWAKGKCGFKALQFMALEKPVVVTPVGVNAEIVENGVTGFHCSTDTEWKEAIIQLIQDQSLREKMGAKGRNKVIAEFSVDSNQDNFLSLFEG